MSEERQSAPDPLLLRWQEDELHEAEKKVLHAFRGGWKEDGWKGEVVVPPEGSSAPEKPAEEHTAEHWQDAVLRAGFLRDLFLGNYGHFDPRQTVISRAWVEGRLTLNYCESQFPLLFSQCIFSEGISLLNATLPRLILKGCKLRLSKDKLRLSKDEDDQFALFAQGSKVISDVRLTNKFRAKGEVILRGAEIGGELRCRYDSYFEGGLNAAGLKVSSNVFLDEKFTAKGMVILGGAEIGGLLRCSDGDFEGGLNAASLKASSDVFLNKSLEAKGKERFEAKGEVILRGAEIGGQLRCSGGYFEGGLNAAGLKVSSSVFLDNKFRAKDKVILGGAEIGGLLRCSDGDFEGGLNAASLKASSDVFLSLKSKSLKAKGKERFEANKGEVILRGAEIGGQLRCSGGDFEGGLNAAGLKVSSNVFLDQGFKANGEVNLRGAEIGGELRCYGSTFKKDLNVGGAEIGGELRCGNSHFEKGLNAANLKASSNVFLDDEFQAKGEVDLSGAEIGGELRCSGSHFEKDLNAANLKASGDVFLGMKKGSDVFLDDKFQAKGEVNLSGSEIGGELRCHGSRFEKGLMAPNLKASSDVLLEGFGAKGEVNLSGAEIGGEFSCSGSDFEKGLNVNSAEVKKTLSMNKDVRCSAEGFRYWRIDFGGGGDWKKGLEWLKKMPSDQFQPYKQLMAAYRRMGHANWSRKIGFALEKKRSEEFKKELKHLPWRAWYGILRLTIGYGYKPFASFLWAAWLLVAGSLLFSSGHEGFVSKNLPPVHTLVNKWFPDNKWFQDNEWIPSDGDALASPNWQEERKPPPDYLPFNPVIYSLESAFPVLNLGQLDKWHPSNPFLLGVRWAWTLIGTLLLAILALFGAGVLGPRTQSGDDSG